MPEVGVRELKQRTSEIIRRVREKKEVFTVTHRGHVVARLVPVEEPNKARENDLQVLAEMRALAEEIGKYLPAGTSAVEAIKEQRREL